MDLLQLKKLIKDIEFKTKKMKTSLTSKKPQLL